MDYKNALINQVKNSLLKREVCIVLKDHLKSPNKSIKRDFCHEFNSLNDRIHSHLDNISKLSNLLPIKINTSLTSPSFPIYEDSIEDCLGSLNNIDNLRILINFEKINRHQLDKIIKSNNSISHLVELTFFEKSDKNSNTTTSPSTFISIKNVSDLIQYIEEVILDICMYYTVFNDATTVEENFRKEFSKKKVEFLKEKEIDLKKWANSDYVSFASFFNHNNSFDYLSYISLWQELGSKLGLILELQEPPEIMNQLKQHLEFGELPLKEIILRYESLPNGEYILARITSIPKRHKSQRTLLAIFGGSVIKRGRWKIFPKHQVPSFEKFKNNVSLFKLLK